MADEHRVMAGDAVDVEVGFRHNANIERVEAHFVNPEVPDGERIEFYETGDNPAVHRREPGALVTDHTSRLRADITEEHAPGVYRCAECFVVTAGGRRHPFTRLPRFTLEVVPEPDEGPAMQGDFRLLDR